jgi:hypothetical protein
MSVTLLPIQGGNSREMPFYRQATTNTSISTHSPVDKMRINRYDEHWRMFNGVQWSFTREGGSPLVTANYARTVVQKKASFLVGRGQIIETPEVLRKITKPKILEVWRDNNEGQKLLEIAITGGVTGDVPILVVYQPPTKRELAVNPYARGRTRIRVLQPHQVFITWNPLNKEDIQRVRVVTEVPMETQETAHNAAVTENVLQKRKFIEDYYADYVEVGWEGEPRSRAPNALGEIPFVHIPNEIFPGEFWGKSDLDDLISLQREFNEKMTDVSDIVHYHAAPITIITGAKAKDLVKGPKALWSGLPEGARVTNLELSGDLGVSFKYLEFIRQLMLDISNIPDGAFGRLQSISNTSGAALQVQFQPLVEVTQRKAENYIRGLQKVNYFILRIDQIVNNTAYPVDLCRSCGGRIVVFDEKLSDGSTRKKKRCYMVDPQTLDFMKPENVKINVTIEHSFGNEVRMVPFGRVKERWGKKYPSYWDPEPMVDREKEAKLKKEKMEEQQAEQREQEQGAADREHERALELKTAGKAPAEGEE